MGRLNAINGQQYSSALLERNQQNRVICSFHLNLIIATYKNCSEGDWSTKWRLQSLTFPTYRLRHILQGLMHLWPKLFWPLETCGQIIVTHIAHPSNKFLSLCTLDNNCSRYYLHQRHWLINWPSWSNWICSTQYPPGLNATLQNSRHWNNNDQSILTA